MSDSGGREARLRPEFAHLYPPITPDRWESAASTTETMLAWLLHRPNAGPVAADRILPPEHFEFRGIAPRPTSTPEGRSRRGDPR